MDNQCNLEKFKILLNKPFQDFKKLIQDGNEELIINLFCALEEENIDKIIAFIRIAERKNERNILDNLLQLEPISLPIIDKFIASDFLEELEFIKRVDIVREISSDILEHLRVEKIKIRKHDTADDSNSNVRDSLEQVIDEIEKHREKLNNLKEIQEKNKEFKALKIQISEIEEELDIKTIEEMDSKIKYYQDKKLDIDVIKKEINKSKELFTYLPKDGA